MKVFNFGAICLVLAAGCSDSSRSLVPPQTEQSNSAPEFSMASTAAVATENDTTTSYQPSATDDDGDALTYNISGGNDASLFSLTPSGTLTFLTAPDFESPLDDNSDNRYAIEISVDDGSGDIASQAVEVEVADVDEAPMWASADTASTDENASTSFYTALATDPESQNLAYSLTNAGDGALFTITAQGELAFLTPADFENPTDADTNNSYNITLAVSDGTNTVTHDLTIGVEDVLPAIESFSLAPTTQPRTVLFSWSMNEVPIDLDHFTITQDPDGSETFIELATFDATTQSGLVELPVLTTKFNTINFAVEARDDQNREIVTSAIIDFSSNAEVTDLIGHFKASNTAERDKFGRVVAMSNDGLTIAIAAVDEDSAATTVNGDEADNTAISSGAVYVFNQNDEVWQQTAYLKASNSEQADLFGSSVAVSDDGSRIVVGAPGEDSSDTGLNALQTDNNASGSGAAYIFELSAGAWSQTAYLKADNSVAGAQFGIAVAISGNGQYVAVGAPSENTNAGAVYHFEYQNTSWVEGDRIQAPAAQPFHFYGNQISFDRTGENLAVAARSYDNPTNAGAVFTYTSAVSTQSRVIEAPTANAAPNTATWFSLTSLFAPNADPSDGLGWAMAMDDDGNTLVVTSIFEDSQPNAVMPNPPENSNEEIGGAYVFVRQANTWSFTDLLKPAAALPRDQWGYAVDISGDGQVIALGTQAESSSGSGIITEANSESPSTGAVSIFRRTTSGWEEAEKVKSSNPQSGSAFGFSAALNHDGELLLVGSQEENSGLTGITTGVVSDTSTSSAGAAYLY